MEGDFRFANSLKAGSHVPAAWWHRGSELRDLGSAQGPPFSSHPGLKKDVWFLLSAGTPGGCEPQDTSFEVILLPFLLKLLSELCPFSGGRAEEIRFFLLLFLLLVDQVTTHKTAKSSHRATFGLAAFLLLFLQGALTSTCGSMACDEQTG